MNKRRRGIRYANAGDEYFAKRGLQKYAGVWSLWALGVGAVISGHYSGWNLGLASGDWGGMFVATGIIAIMYLGLTLSRLKPPVLNGIDGLSQKSSEPGNASYYYSMTRLGTIGTLQIENEDYSVTGLSWLDREWGSSGLSREQQGWDWFSIQLSDGSDLMFYSLRKNDGSRDPYSAGTWITADGHSMHLSNDDVSIDVEDHWDSPLGGTYPMAWRVRIPQADLDLRLRPVLDAQELRTAVRYWEGAVDVVGRKAGMPVEGRGYVELTGYARRDPG